MNHHQEHAVLWVVISFLKLSQNHGYISESILQFFFLRTMVINQRTVPVTTGSVPACYDHKCLFFICILVSGFKAFEKFQNQRTTHSGYLKILKELVGFVKEP